MTIKHIKEHFNIPQFNFFQAFDKADEATEWYRHWENTLRTAISIHKDLLKQIMVDPSINNLDMQFAEREGEQGKYIAVRIVRYTDEPDFVV